MSSSVGTQFFKAPELILGYNFYNYSVDIWSAGMIMGSLLYRKFPLILGDSIFVILIKIIEVLGND